MKAEERGMPGQPGLRWATLRAHPAPPLCAGLPILTTRAASLPALRPREIPTLHQTAIRRLQSALILLPKSRRLSPRLLLGSMWLKVPGSPINGYSNGA